MYLKKAFLFLLLVCTLTAGCAVSAAAEDDQTDAAGTPNPAAKSAMLMEAKTGTVIYEKNADEQLRPASVTKVMTLLLIFEGLEKNQYALEDVVTVSEHAASMGGSQVFLEAGETQTVHDLDQMHQHRQRQ